VATLTATATCTAYRAVIDATGELVGQRQLAERVGWLAALASHLTEQILAARWTEKDLDTLAAGVDEAGRPLPAKGWMALRRLRWTAAAAVPNGVHVSDRVRRAAEEAAARALRLALHRRAIVDAILATWPDDPYKRSDADWAALRSALPAGTSTAEVRNRTRQLRAWARRHDGKLPAGITELEASPQCLDAPPVLLAAADKQLTTLTRTSERDARLRLQLPLTATPPPTPTGPGIRSTCVCPQPSPPKQNSPRQRCGWPVGRSG
jgi:hypothetical protein